MPESLFRGLFDSDLTAIISVYDLFSVCLYPLYWAWR